MTTYSITQRPGYAASQRRTRRRGLVILAAAAVVALLMTFGSEQPSADRGALAEPAPIHTIEDWRGNSASFRPAD